MGVMVKDGAAKPVIATVDAFKKAVRAGARDVAAARALIQALVGPMAAPVLKSKGMEGPAP
jgi:hypothetical protein